MRDTRWAMVFGCRALAPWQLGPGQRFHQRHRFGYRAAHSHADRQRVGNMQQQDKEKQLYHPSGF